MNIILLICVYVFIIVLGILSLQENEKKKKVILAIQSISIGVFYGLRDISIGHDTIHYFAMYENTDCFFVKNDRFLT